MKEAREVEKKYTINTLTLESPQIIRMDIVETPIPTGIPTISTMFRLSTKDYGSLGKPGLGDVLTIKLTVEGGQVE